MTWREMLEQLGRLNNEQLGQTVTVEMGPEDEFYPAELRFCGTNHDVLDFGHPVIYVP